MKKLKILLPAIAAVTTLSLTACGNQSLGSGNHTYDHCHMQIVGTETARIKHYKIQSWRNCDGGWELNLETDRGVVNVWIADDNVTCYKGSYCPICGANK